mmetsp:Transcript_28678/g.72617  ORF Transcript_28678/g.72617 Transcript_28678/m.72617 type:complete len:380 (+) Transcript_28678:943-2082(+)|eukprot:CAMPEP_0178994266 /NCGR_PEP_ID=MMETSP0795-20121207/7179_1 /TAXON_ID=88552 /ORGANISM="Amoebophrya sp., Strain Ameob2" /LENGTH=379 /DNA_ID=CAMNT_0020686449 /DNA_START=971 /DNA_END=2110 /DNA_ORIENTATION=-
MADRQLTNLTVSNAAKLATFGSTVGATIDYRTRHLGIAVPEKTWLKPKFQVGSCKSDKIDLNQCEKVFHSGDVPDSVTFSKKAVQGSKRGNILGTQKDAWNTSVAAQARLSKAVGSTAYSGQGEHRRTLAKIRAGLMDAKTMKNSKHMTEEQIADRIRYVVAITGKGPIGKFVGKWWNAVDERGLPAHCINPDWPDFDASSATQWPEDIKQAERAFLQKEKRRLRMNVVDEKLNFDKYDSLLERFYIKNKDIEDKKVEYQDLKDLFKHELSVEFPGCSEERLQAMAQRLLDEKLQSDLKLQRFPVQHESFKPNCSLTTQDRRYKQYYHPGAWTYMESEGRFAWSCCANYKEDSRGCAFKVVNPDRWCTDGFEKGGPLNG